MVVENQRHIPALHV